MAIPALFNVGNDKVGDGSQPDDKSSEEDSGVQGGDLVLCGDWPRYCPAFFNNQYWVIGNWLNKMQRSINKIP